MADKKPKGSNEGDKPEEDIKNNPPDESQGSGEDENKDDSIPKHRFNEINEKLKKAEKKLGEMEETKLEEQEKFKTLAEKRKEKVETLSTELKDTKIRYNIERVASQKGASDPSDVYNLLDKSNIELSEDGEVTGVEDAVDDLLENKPYLTGEGDTAKSIGAGSSPTKDDKSETYSLEWFKEKWADPKWVRETHEFEGQELTGEQILNKLEKDDRITAN